MQRETLTPKANWTQRVEKYGFDIHHFDGVPYWGEDTAYRFTMGQIDEIEDATNTLHGLCLAAVDKVVTDYRKGDTRLISQFSIDQQYWPLIAESWEKGEKNFYSRFDLSYDGKSPPKMLEYNADTPTSIMEAAIVQWYWLQDYKPEADQFNSIHERMTECWNTLASPKDGSARPTLHFAGCTEVREDVVALEYIRDTAAQAGFRTKSLDISDIGYNPDTRKLVDNEGEEMTHLFKLYPWEHIVRDEFAKVLHHKPVNWHEPMWEMLLSNKAILPVLWELNPGHPNLVKSSFNAADFAGEDHVVKPKLSREGANIKVVLNGMAAQHNDGIYDEKDSIYQAYAPLPKFGEYRPVIGSWVVGDEAAGMGIREDKSLITGNDSRFVPHYIMG